MKTNLLTTLSIVVVMLFSACNRDDDNITQQTLTLAESQAPNGFLYESTNSFKVLFNLTSQTTTVGSVKVLDENYNTLRSLSVNGMSGEIELREPATQDVYYLYIPEANVLHKFNRDGKSIVNLNVDLDNGKNKTNLVGSVVPPTVNCGSAVSFIVRGSRANDFQLSSATTVAKSFNGKIIFTNTAQMLDVCENSTLTGVEIWSNGTRTIRVAEGAVLTITASSVDSRLAIINMGTVIFTNNISWGNDFINYGTVISNPNNGATNFYGTAAFVNYGTFTTNSSFDFNTSTTGYNYGTFNAPSMQINTNNEFENQCQMNISGNFSINNNGVLINSGFLGVGGTTQLNTSGEVQMNGSTAVILTETMTLNNNARFIASGGTGIVKVNDVFTTNFSNWNNSNSGLMEFCVGTASGNGASSLPTGFAYGCNAFVPVGPCNPVQIGMPTVVDNDGDGVAAGIDYDDNDATVAYREEAPYMIVNSFEDLWPAKGDYDFNDLVIKQRPTVYRHANNNVTKIEYRLVVHAIGAGLSNGLALQFLQPASGNGYDLISSPIVTSVSSPFVLANDNLIQLAGNVRDLQSSYYTNVGSGPIQIPDTMIFTVNMDFNATQPNVLITDFFIFRTANVGHEVHLPGRHASLRVDNTFFTNADDDTDVANGKWYLTENNLPWGIEIVEQDVVFKHPKTKVSIDVAYPEFLNWVMSNGNNNQNWAKNPNVGMVFFFPND